MGPKLTSLGINLHEEHQVGYLLKTVETLAVLNGIEVERDALFEPSNHEEKESGTDRQEEMRLPDANGVQLGEGGTISN